MKKYVIALLVLCLVLCGCSELIPTRTTVSSQDAGQAAATVAPTETTLPTETTVPPTTEATIPAPALKWGTAMVDDTPAILKLLMRGDIVDVVGEFDDDYYVIKTEAGYGLVEKELLRKDGEAAFQVWTGYAFYLAEFYENFRLTGEPVKKLYQNTAVEVLDDLGWSYVVRVDNTVGYMKKAQVSQRPFYSGGGGSSSGGSTGADGGDITMQFQGGVMLLAAIQQEGDVTGQATVLADGVEVVLGFFNRGEQVPMVAEDGFAKNWDGYVTVYLNGLYAYVPEALVLVEGKTYEAWDGYSYWNGVVYDNYYLLGDPIDKLYTNVQVHVIAELENCYLVEVNGTTGYMGKDLVSHSRIPTGGETGSGTGEEWSPPVL